MQSCKLVESGFGRMLAAARRRGRVSQLELALIAGVSQRHVSFLEIDRATPSREMVLRLASALSLSLADQNILLNAAGFSPEYNDSVWDAPSLGALRRALQYACDRHEPFPALVVDCAWRPIELNASAEMIFGSLSPRTGFDPEKSLLRSLVEAQPVINVLDDWFGLVEHMARRLRLERALLPRGPLQVEIDRALAAAAEVATGRRVNLDTKATPTFNFGLRSHGIHLKLIATVASFAEPFDVGAANLRLECFYPADERTEASLFQIASMRAAAQ